MKKISRTNDILNLITSYTANGITAHTYDFTACNAHDISLILKIDRTNVSRVLNQLHRDNRLIKLQGRPTLYLDASVLHSFSTETIPYVLPTGKDIRDYLQKETTIKTKTPPLPQPTLSYTGIQQNEALFPIYKELLSILYYPDTFITIALEAPKGEGKQQFLQFFAEKAKELHLLPNDCTILIHNYDSETDIKSIRSVLNSTSGNIFFILSVNNDTLQPLANIQKELKELTKKNRTVCILCYLFSSTSEKQKDFIRFQANYSLTFPLYHQRTLKERLELIFQQIQIQSDLLNETICLHKNVLTCMALADQEYTTYDLLQEVRRSIVRAHYSFREKKANIIDIAFEHLSDSLLNRISDVSSRFAELHSILDTFDSDILYFISHTPCRFYNTLHAMELNEQHLLKQKNNEQIISICNAMLKKTEKIEINTIRSIFVKELYDMIFPLLSTTPLKQNESMIFVLFEYLQNLIGELKTDTYRCAFTETNGAGTKRTDQLSENIAQIIENRLQVILPKAEQTLISTYLQLAIQKLEAKTPILFLCHGEDIATNYEKYIRSANLYDSCYSINYSEAWRRKEYHHFLDYVCDFIQQIDHHEYVIIFSDITPLTEIGEQINTRLHIRTKTYAPISLPLILNTISSHSSEVDNANKFTQAPDFPSASLSENSRLLINRISSQILQQSLVFLDATKASSSLMVVLLNILKELKINYSDEITIRFIIHGAFVIERAIRNDPLPNKKTREIINMHNQVFHTISRELNELNNVFNICIAKTEIATITQIFLEYM